MGGAEPQKPLLMHYFRITLMVGWLAGPGPRTSNSIAFTLGETRAAFGESIYFSLMCTQEMGWAWSWVQMLVSQLRVV